MSPASAPQLPDHNAAEPPEWFSVPGAAATVAELRQEVATICEYAQEAAGDLEQPELPEVDLDNVQIAVSSINTAAGKALTCLARLLEPSRDRR